MTKINQKEYETLKELDDKWKWIARNRDGGLYKFQETPEKIDSFRWNDRKQTWLGIYGNLFQFIQWEDEEPSSIAELIEEYEDKEFYDYVGWEYHKSDKSEVKKDMDWLNNELEKVIKDVESDDISFAGKDDYDEGYIDGIRDVQSIIHRLVETEKKYYVMNNDNRMMLVRMMDGKTITEADPFKLEDMYEGEKESHRLTEKEIKDYDERYWAFRKPVGELEE